MIKVILFDADGVLIPKKWVFSQILETEHGITRQTTSAFFSGIFQDCLVGKADLKESISPFLPAWGWEKSVDEFLNYWFTSEHVLNKELLDYIQTLKKKGVKCYVATNNEVYRVRYMTDKMGFSQSFEQIFASSSLGFKKPDREFFQAIMKNLKGVRRSEVLLWDDSLEHVEAAKKFGFKAEIYTSFEDLRLKTDKYLVSKLPC